MLEYVIIGFVSGVLFAWLVIWVIDVMNKK